MTLKKKVKKLLKKALKEYEDFQVAMKEVVRLINEVIEEKYGYFLVATEDQWMQKIASLLERESNEKLENWDKKYQERLAGKAKKLKK